MKFSRQRTCAVLILGINPPSAAIGRVLTEALVEEAAP